MHVRLRALCAGIAFVIASTNMAAAAPPFVVTASSGPAAGSHIDATVTRVVAGIKETLPAALVPALEPGDDVRLDFPDYRKPPGSVNYHVNAAFITETAPQQWLFERSGPYDRLFENRRAGKRHVPAAHGVIHFVYGAPKRKGIPIFFIIPEDGKTRGVDGVRDYVAAHPTDFVNMAQSTNAAVDHYSFLSDFLTSLGNGSIDPTTSRARIESIAQSLGVSPATIDGCYLAGGTTADVRNCIQQSVNAVIYQTNFSAPTQAQFLGGLAAAASPATYAPYLASLLTVWQLFVHTGHNEYEYLPTTITLADPSAVRQDQLLMGLKVPTIRPPAAFSDVLFFTIGDSQGSEHAPAVVNDAPAEGVCGRTARFGLPLRFDHTSRYVHDAALIVTPDGRTASRIALDPRSLAAPVIDRARLPVSADQTYTIGLDGRFGFDSVLQPAETTMRLALPSAAAWSVEPMAHRAISAGGNLDAIARSPAAACLSRAELQVGDAAPIAIAATHLDADRVELHASLSGLPAGIAHVRFYEDDPMRHTTFESSSAVTIDPAPARVLPASATAARNDGFIELAGTGFDRIAAVRIGGTDYAKQSGATASAACFAGPPLADTVAGQQLTAQLIGNDGDGAEVFPIVIAPARPLEPLASIVPPPAAPALSSASLLVMLQTPGSRIPLRRAVRLRQLPPGPESACDRAQNDPTAVTIPDAALNVRANDTIAVSLHPDLLGDRASGTLQLQLVDATSGLASDWVSLPATFVRAPHVTQIVCPADTAQPCRLYGTQLTAIDGVQNETGAITAPGLDCPPTDKGVACLFVPRLSHYVVELVDAHTLETLPDSLVTSAPH